MATSSTQKKRNIDWIAIRTAYVVRRWTAQQCADEFHVDATTIRKRASKEKWTVERHKNATAGAEVVAKELQAAAIDEIRVHAKRVERVLRLSDEMIARVESELGALPRGGLGQLKLVVETYQRLVDSISKGVISDRLVRGIKDNAPSDPNSAGDDKPNLIRFVIVGPDGDDRVVTST